MFIVNCSCSNCKKEYCCFSEDELKYIEDIEWEVKNDAPKDCLEYKIDGYSIYMHVKSLIVPERDKTGPNHVILKKPIKIHGTTDEEKLQWIGLVLKHINDILDIPLWNPSLYDNFSLDFNNDTLYMIYADNNCSTKGNGACSHIFFNQNRVLNIYDVTRDTYIPRNGAKTDGPDYEVVFNCKTDRLNDCLRDSFNTIQVGFQWMPAIIEEMANDFELFIDNYREYILNNLWMVVDWQICSEDSFIARIIIKDACITQIDFSLGMGAKKLNAYVTRDSFHSNEENKDLIEPLYYRKSLKLAKQELRSNKKCYPESDGSSTFSMIDLNNIEISRIPKSKLSEYSTYSDRYNRLIDSIGQAIGPIQITPKNPIPISGRSATSVIQSLMTDLSRIDPRLVDLRIPKEALKNFSTNRWNDTIIILYGANEDMTLDDLIVCSDNKVMDIMNVSDFMATENLDGNTTNKRVYCIRLNATYQSYIDGLSMDDWQKRMLPELKTDFTNCIDSIRNWYLECMNYYPKGNVREKSYVIRIIINDARITKIQYSILPSPGITYEWWKNKHFDEFYILITN